MRTVPNLLSTCPSINYSASLRTKFMCKSKLVKIPLNSLSPLSLIKTGEFVAFPNASSGL